MRNEKCTAIVLAAGQGTRMGGKVRKQFMELQGKPLLCYCLQCFQDSKIIDEIVLVAGAGQEDFCRKEIVEKYGFSKVKKVLAGGKERYDSVYNGLRACEDATYVFIHDGARPFVTEEILHRGYETVKTYGAAVAGVPSKDTVKIVNKENCVLETPPRTQVWSVQTPQIFAYQTVRSAYDRLQNSDKTGITDDAMVVEQMGKQEVCLFLADYRNIKITTPDDWEVAEVLCHSYGAVCAAAGGICGRK